jgi:Protein of unknown function (DUF4235)
LRTNRIRAGRFYVGLEDGWSLASPRLPAASRPAFVAEGVAAPSTAAQSARFVVCWGRGAMKLLYKPFGLLVSVLGGILAGALFNRLWRALSGDAEAPSAKDQDRPWREVITAAAVQGAVFGGVKALIDRAGATGFARLTGVWPGKTETKQA